MRILHVTPWFPPALRYGGVPVCAFELARAQVALGHQVTVLTTDADGAGQVDVEPLEVRDGVRVRTFRASFPRRLFQAPGLNAALPDELNDTDVLHVHGLYHAPGLAAVRRARRLRVVTAVSPHGMLVRELIEQKSRWAKRGWLSLFPARSVERWFATSERDRRDQIELDVPAARITVIPNGIPEPDVVDNAIRPLVRNVLDRPGYLLFVGRLSWKKGLTDLLDAWLPHAENVRLVLAGPDDEGLGHELERQHADLVERGRFVRLPQVAQHEALALMEEAVGLALFSRHESFANVVFEAASVGTPVVLHNTVGASEWIERAGAGWVVPPGGAAGAVDALLLDEAERRIRGERGRELAARWGWDRVAREVLAHYAGPRSTAL